MEIMISTPNEPICIDELLKKGLLTEEEYKKSR